MKVYALSDYDGVIRDLVLSKNYRSPIGSRQLGELLAASACCPWNEFDCVVPIPLHWTRYAWRGFNQATVMARAIRAVHRISIIYPAVRSARTMQQTRLAYGDRQRNVRDIFVLRRGGADLLRGKRVLLLDDVMTTGATLRALARTLTAAEPAAIAAIVAARVL